MASDITVAYYDSSVVHTREYIALDDTWAEHVARCRPMLTVLEVANTLDPTNKHIIKNGISVAQSLIEGVVYRDPYDTTDQGNAKTKTKYLTSLTGGEKLAAQVRQTMTEFIAKMKAIDPTYEAPKLQMASGPGCSPGCAVIIAVLVIGFVVLMILAKLSKGREGAACRGGTCRRAVAVGGVRGVAYGGLGSVLSECRGDRGAYRGGK